MSLALENRTKNGYLTNLKHGRCFAGACFPEPAGVVYNVVRAFIYYDNGKIPFQHINRRPEPVFYNWIINSSIVMFLPMNRKRTGAVDTGFLRNSLSFVTIPSSNDDVVENQHLVQVPFRRIRR
jgi:hypothetical protein